MEEKKVLVAYGTRYGSTRIVAGDVEEFLKEKGHQVDVVNLRKERVSEKLEDYDLVVSGSSVAIFSWVGKVKRFLRRCRRVGVPTVVYICCGTAIESPERAAVRFLNRVMNRIGLKPVWAQAICPVIDFRPNLGLSKKLKKRIRGIIQTMAKDNFLENGLMDFRNRDRFNNFLVKIGECL